MTREETAQANGTVLRGRQILFLLYESFKANMHIALVFSVTDLAKPQYPGDAYMHELRFRGDLATGSMPETLGGNTLVTILLQKLESSRDPSEDSQHYFRCSDDHPDHSYRFVKSCLDRCIARRQQAKNRADQMAVFSRTPQTNKARAATPALDNDVTPWLACGDCSRGVG